MKKLLFWTAVTALLVYLLSPQWRSYGGMGERRFAALKGVPKEILVGVCWPFTENQDGMADGLALALDEINRGGLAGVPIRLVMREEAGWQHNKEVAIEFANTPRMSAVLGYYDDADAIKASMIYESAKLLHIITGSNSTPMTARGLQYIVRTVVSSDKIARSLAKLTQDRGRKKVALIWEEDAYGEDLAYQYRVALEGLDVKLVYQWSYLRERADFRQAVNDLRGVDEDMIFFAGMEPWAGDFIREARKVGVNSEILGAFSDTPSLRERAGAALEGCLIFDEYNPGGQSPENQAFVRKFRARFHKDPDIWAAQGYDALHILAKAVRATDSANPLDLSYAIRFMDPWEGANGRYKFDSRGEMEGKPIYLSVFRHGKSVVVQESPAYSPADPEKEQAHAPAAEGTEATVPTAPAAPVAQPEQ